MAKFYVQSGTFRRVVAAESCQKAALWAIHEVMQQILPTEDKLSQSAETVTVLSACVRVDERGFDRNDARELSTMEVMGQWTEMVMTLDRLQQMLDGTPSATPAAKGRITHDDFSNGHISDDLAA